MRSEAVGLGEIERARTGRVSGAVVTFNACNGREQDGRDLILNVYGVKPASLLIT